MTACRSFFESSLVRVRRTAALVSAAIPLALNGNVVNAQDKGAVEDYHKIIPLPITADRVPTFHTVLTPIPTGKQPAGGGGIAGSCPGVTVTHTDASFTGGTYVLQGGMVETEIAAASFSVPANQFPIKIDLMEMIFGTSNAAVQTTTQWSIIVWDGTPTNGTIAAEYSSDGTILPHIVLPPGTSGINVAVSVDPGDPDQIFLYNTNGSGKFTVGYRIDKHNNPPTSTCPCVAGFPEFGLLPALCCPPSPLSNAFPATDQSNCSSPPNNWLFARACPGATGFCASPAGWHTFSESGLPNHDWVIRATYKPLTCVPAIGACCLANGTCLEGLTAAECAAQTGTYQSDGSTCAGTNCPVPSGACCINGSCSQKTFTQCQQAGGTFLGANTTCGTNSCKGACCVPSTQQCVFATAPNCAAVSGIFQGLGTTCAGVVCFPIGACCLPDGSCTGGQSPGGCAALGGVFQGNATTCASVSCPIPEGACCIGTICLDAITEIDCTVGFGGTWSGPQSVCGASTCEPQCIADLAPIPGNGIVNIDDLLAVINAWGPCTGPGCHADVAPPGGNAVINVDDMLFVINHWGPCP